MWDIFDKDGNWLGTAPGTSESQALDYARANGMSEAESAAPCED